MMMWTAVRTCGRLLALVFLLSNLQAASSSPAQLATVEFEKKLKEVTDQTLGLTDLQDQIDSDATFSVTIPDGAAIIKSVTEDLGLRFNQYNKAVTDLRDVTERNFGTFSDPPPMEEECCRESEARQYNSKYYAYVDTKAFCFSVPYYSSRNITWNLDDFLSTVRKNENLPKIAWQYIGTEEGWLFSYPSQIRDTCDKYDPRMRPWYAEVSVPIPKDIVIIFDYTQYSNFNITIKAIETLINTTNPNDRIGIVTVPKTESDHRCYSTNLALATPANYPFFSSLLSRIRTSKQIDHREGYIEAFIKAFKYFRDVDSQGYRREKETRRKLIIFITDQSYIHAPTVDKVLEAVKQKNEEHNNSVLINTYAFGNDVNADTKDILKKLAEMTFFTTSKNVTKIGKFTEIKEENYGSTRNELGSYYNAFAESGGVQSPIITVPYVDYFGLGLVISLCLPLHDKQDVLKGTACVDATILEIFQNVTYFGHNKDSYAFLIDKKGRTIIHPLLAKPTEIKDKPKFVDITALETEEEVLAVINSMESGGNGSMSLLVSRQGVPSLNTGVGDPQEKIMVHYYWQAVPYSDYSLCLVLVSSDWETELIKLRQPKTGPTPDEAYCTHDGVPVKPGQLQIVDSGHEHRRDKDDMEKLTGRVGALWEERKEHTPFLYWRYLVTTSGVMLIYPRTDFSLNPYKEQWYTTAMEEKNKFILTQVTSSRGNSIMLSSALLTGKNSKDRYIPIGVMAGEYRPEYFYHIILDAFPACHQANTRCFLMDRLGYIIVHPERLHSTSKDHIVHVEPEVAAYLKRNNHLTGVNCSDYEDFEARHYWKVSLDQIGYIHSDNPLFELHSIHYSNVFIAITWEEEKDEDEEENPTPTTQLPRNFWQCSSTETCACPCETDLKFNSCNNTPDAVTRKTTPNCPIEAETHPVVHKRERVLNATNICFPCPSFSTERECIQAIGCDWCYPEDDPSVTSLRCLRPQECSYTPRETSEFPLVNKIIIPIIILLLLGLIIGAVILFKKKRHEKEMKNKAEVNGINGSRPPAPLPPEVKSNSHDNPAFLESLPPEQPIYSTVVQDGDDRRGVPIGQVLPRTQSASPHPSPPPRGQSSSVESLGSYHPRTEYLNCSEDEKSLKTSSNASDGYPCSGSTPLDDFYESDEILDDPFMSDGDNPALMMGNPEMNSGTYSPSRIPPTSPTHISPASQGRYPKTRYPAARFAPAPTVTDERVPRTPSGGPMVRNPENPMLTAAPPRTTPENMYVSPRRTLAPTVQEESVPRTPPGASGMRDPEIPTLTSPRTPTTPQTPISAASQARYPANRYPASRLTYGPTGAEESLPRTPAGASVMKDPEVPTLTATPSRTRTPQGASVGASNPGNAARMSVSPPPRIPIGKPPRTPGPPDDPHSYINEKPRPKSYGHYRLSFPEIEDLAPHPRPPAGSDDQRNPGIAQGEPGQYLQTSPQPHRPDLINQNPLFNPGEARLDLQGGMSGESSDWSSHDAEPGLQDNYYTDSGMESGYPRGHGDSVTELKRVG